MTEMDARFEAEARERWGDTPAWKEAHRRTRGYTGEQVERIKAELEEVESEFARLLEAGAEPGDDAVVQVAERARLHIDRWYYPCPPAMHVALSRMYVQDPRFKAHYDDRLEGLAEFVARAIQANAAREAG